MHGVAPLGRDTVHCLYGVAPLGRDTVHCLYGVIHISPLRGDLKKDPHYYNERFGINPLASNSVAEALE